MAILRTDEPLFNDVNELQWRGPASAFADFAAKIGEPALSERVNAAASKVLNGV